VTVPTGAAMEHRPSMPNPWPPPPPPRARCPFCGHDVEGSQGGVQCAEVASGGHSELRAAGAGSRVETLRWAMTDDDLLYLLPPLRFPPLPVPPPRPPVLQEICFQLLEPGEWEEWPTWDPCPCCGCPGHGRP